jgi:hypothetical protein
MFLNLFVNLDTSLKERERIGKKDEKKKRKKDEREGKMSRVREGHLIGYTEKPDEDLKEERNSCSIKELWLHRSLKLSEFHLEHSSCQSIKFP